MSIYICKDIAIQIQSYMDNKSFIISLLVCKSFTPQTKVHRLFEYNNSLDKLPWWVTRVKLAGIVIENILVLLRD